MPSKSMVASKLQNSEHGWPHLVPVSVLVLGGAMLSFSYFVVVFLSFGYVGFTCGLSSCLVSFIHVDVLPCVYKWN